MSSGFSLLASAEDPYALWSAGKPDQALPALYETARSKDRWDAWLDAGLAAAAAGDRGHAAAWLVEADRHAPERKEARQALRALGCSLPTSWIERVGPLAITGCGWIGVIVMAISGLSLGSAIFLRRRRTMLLTIGVLALIAALPGQVALSMDARHQLVAVVKDTHLLDTSGQPRQALAAGTIAVKQPREAWANRILVQLTDGSRGFLPLPDCDAKL